VSEKITLLRKYADFCFYLSDALSTRRIDTATLETRKKEWLALSGLEPGTTPFSPDEALVARALVDYANALLNRLYHELGQE